MDDNQITKSLQADLNFYRVKAQVKQRKDQVNILVTRSVSNDIDYEVLFDVVRSGLEQLSDLPEDIAKFVVYGRVAGSRQPEWQKSGELDRQSLDHLAAAELLFDDVQSSSHQDDDDTLGQALKVPPIPPTVTGRSPGLEDLATIADSLTMDGLPDLDSHMADLDQADNDDDYDDEPATFIPGSMPFDLPTDISDRFGSKNNGSSADLGSDTSDVAELGDRAGQELSDLGAGGLSDLGSVGGLDVEEVEADFADLSEALEYGGIGNITEIPDLGDIIDTTDTSDLPELEDVTEAVTTDRDAVDRRRQKQKDMGANPANAGDFYDHYYMQQQASGEVNRDSGARTDQDPEAVDLFVPNGSGNSLEIPNYHDRDPAELTIEQSGSANRKSNWGLISLGAIVLVVFGGLFFFFDKKQQERKLFEARSITSSLLAPEELGKLQAIQEMEKELSVAIDLLEDIPNRPGSPFLEAQAQLRQLENKQTTLQQKLTIEETATSQLNAAKTLAMEAATLVQNPPHSSEVWQQAQSKWQQSVDLLKKVPEGTLASEEAKSKLVTYEQNYAAITGQLQKQQAFDLAATYWPARINASDQNYLRQLKANGTGQSEFNSRCAGRVQPSLSATELQPQGYQVRTFSIYLCQYIWEQI
jgi:hypothetical protein